MNEMVEQIKDTCSWSTSSFPTIIYSGLNHFFLCHSYSFCYDYFRSMSCDVMKQESLNVEAGLRQEIPVDDDDEIQSIKVKVEKFTSCENEGECSNESFSPSEVGKIL